MVFLIIITKFGGTCTYKVKLVAFLENFKSLVVLVAKHSSKYLGKTGKSYTQVTVQINKDGQLEMLEVDKFQREARKKKQLSMENKTQKLRKSKLKGLKKDQTPQGGFG